ncbi:MAG: FG-GAP-like repeat-containing protein, partial [Candidatus Zixiibacteriota bacterium]
ILAASPGITTERLIEIIEQSADDIIDPYGTGDNLPGKDIYSGYGRVNLNSALQLLSGRLAKIDYPYHDAVISGEVATLGTASGDSFQSYILEYGEGYSPQDWIEIKSSYTPVSKDTLGIWNTLGLTGRYTLRLTVGEQNQAVVRVIVNNGASVQITSPTEGDTIEISTEIRGYAIAPDFSHYTLEYGEGESPSHWYTITSSNKAGADDSLASWLVSFLKESNYTLRLTAQTNTAETYSDSIEVFVKGHPFGGWSQYIPSYGSISPAVGDIDGDGYDEVVLGVGGPELYGITGGVYVFSHQGQLEAGWPKDADRNMFSSPALGDLDNDGIDDIVICSEQGVHAYLSTYSDWTREANTSSGSASERFAFATPTIADLENDGYLEVLTVNKEETVFAWRNDGQPVIPGYEGVFVETMPVFEIGFPSLAVADLDRDGENEIVVAVGGSYVLDGIFIYDIEGNMLLGPDDYPDRFNTISGIAVANIDQCDDLEIIVFGGNTDYYVTLSAFKKDGSQAEGYPIVLESLSSTLFMGHQPAIGDLDGDGTLEIVVTLWAGGAFVLAWHQDGTPLDPEGDHFLVRGICGTFGSPVLADINGDDNVEIIVRGGFNFSYEPFACWNANPERIHAFDYNGDSVPGFPLYVSSEACEFTTTPYTPVIGDLDKDGKLDMVLCTDEPNFQLIFWELDADYDSTKTPWPKNMHDKWNSKVFEKETLDTTVQIAWEPGEFTDPYVHVPLNQVDTLYLIIERSGTRALNITEISSGAGWLSIDPTSGTIPPGGCALDVELIVSGGSEETFLVDSIRIVSNDEVGNDDIYVRMHVVVSDVYKESEFAVVGNPNYYLSESNVGNLGHQEKDAGFYLYENACKPNFLTDGTVALAFTSPDNDSLVARYIFDEHYLLPETELAVDSFPYLKTIVAEAKFSPVTPQAPLPWHHQWWYWTIQIKDYIFYSGVAASSKEQYLALRILYLYYNPPPDWWPFQDPLPNIPETYLGMVLDIDCPCNWDAWNYPFIDSSRRMAYLQGYSDAAMEYFRMALAQRDPCYKFIPGPLDTIICCWPDPVVLAQPDRPYALHILRNDAFIYPQNGYDDDSLYKYLSTPGYSVYGSGNEADYNIVTTGRVIPAQSFPAADTYSVAYALAVSDQHDVAHLDTLVDMVLCGNANRDNTVSVADIVSVINYLFKSGSEPWLYMSDCDADGEVTIADAVCLVHYMFKSGYPPRCSSIH